MNSGRRFIFHAYGAYAMFATLFSFVLPPIGFLMAFKGYWRDRQIGERYVGWIVLMVLATYSSLVITIGLIMMIVYSGKTTSEEITLLIPYIFLNK